MTNLQLLRISRDMTQHELAEKLGITAWLISRMERRWLTRAPAGVEERLLDFFGEGWNFHALMQEPPEPVANSGDDQPASGEAAK